jgi:hypothetical protein
MKLKCKLTHKPSSFRIVATKLLSVLLDQTSIRKFLVWERIGFRGSHFIDNSKIFLGHLDVNITILIRLK